MINLTEYNFENIEHQKLLNDLMNDKNIRLNVSSILIPNKSTYIIEDQKNKVGLIKLNAEYNKSYSVDIGILSKYQNNKYGQLALKEVEKLLKNWDVIKIRTHFKNLKAINIAKKNGYYEDYIENEKCMEEGVSYKILVKYNKT